LAAEALQWAKWSVAIGLPAMEKDDSSPTSRASVLQVDNGSAPDVEVVEWQPPALQSQATEFAMTPVLDDG
jgi:hypothetical protein